MQALFKDIIADDIDAVRQRLDKKSDTVRLTATSPPKKYDGQSPLQVAYRTGKFEIAALLLEHGADPNFIEHTEREPWAMPVLHHAITAAVMRSRWLAPTWREDEPWRLRNTAERADEAYTALKLLLDSSADIHANDSYGNSAIARACLDARQILPRHRYNDPEWVDPKPLNPELVEDLERVFDLLLAHGADPHSPEHHEGSETPVAEFYRKEPVAQFLRVERQAPVTTKAHAPRLSTG